MANYKIFQDNPDQARIKIYGSNSVALNTDSSGNLTITSTGLAITAPADGLAITSTGLAITAPANGLTVTASVDGLAITPPAGGLSITPPSGGLAITPPTNGLAITSTGLAITAPTNGLTVTASTDGLSITPPTNGLMITSAGLAITAPTNGLLITSTGLAMATATTDVSATMANISDTGGSGDSTFNVLGVATWTFGVVNASTVANAQALVKLQISPDGTNWLDEAGPTTINQNSLSTFVSSIFLKYARVYYSAVNAASAVTLNIFFQGELM